MSYIRLTVATPPPERLAEVRQRYEEIVTYVATLPGFVTGWVVAPGHGDREVGRLTVWQTEAAANRAANDPHTMALHAQIQFAVSGNLWDRSFDTDAPWASATTDEHELDAGAAVRAVEALYKRRNRQPRPDEQ